LGFFVGACVMAELLAVDGWREQAVEVFEFLLGQPEDFRMRKEDIAHWLAVLEAELPPEAFAAARQRGKAHDGGTMGAFLAEQLPVILEPAQAAVPLENPVPYPTAQPLPEPLSERELEVLRLMTDGLSNREIAETLVVTVGTVKKHLNNIFGKLDARSRTQAAARARELHLLP
jgi:ATP/maltotriose-dependent transcriptional regulator MalT